MKPWQKEVLEWTILIAIVGAIVVLGIFPQVAGF